MLFLASSEDTLRHNSQGREKRANESWIRNEATVSVRADKTLKVKTNRDLSTYCTPALLRVADSVKLTRS